jgi:hypothetical protein
MVPLKLTVVAERWKMSLREPDPSQIVLRREVRAEPRKPGRPDSRHGMSPTSSGIEVVVRRPTPPSAEFTAVAAMFGSPDEVVARGSPEDMPAILDQIRGALQNLAERRAHPRITVDFAIRVYPLYPDGIIGLPVAGRVRDLSAGGVRFVTPTPVRTERVYVEFPEVEGVAGLAGYVRLLRTSQDVGGEGVVTVGRFRTSGDPRAALPDDGRIE